MYNNSTIINLNKNITYVEYNPNLVSYKNNINFMRFFFEDFLIFLNKKRSKMFINRITNINTSQSIIHLNFSPQVENNKIKMNELKNYIETKYELKRFNSYIDYVAETKYFAIINTDKFITGYMITKVGEI